MFKFIAGALCLLALQHFGWGGIESLLTAAGRGAIKAVSVAQNAVETVAQ